jgi:hypothetical protein
MNVMLKPYLKPHHCSTTAALPVPAHAGDGVSAERTNCGNRTHQHHGHDADASQLLWVSRMGAQLEQDATLTSGPDGGAYLVDQRSFHRYMLRRSFDVDYRQLAVASLSYRPRRSAL